MGMFDDVQYECICPVCNSKVDGFQSKDGECYLAKIEPLSVDNFYASCGSCGCWIEFNAADRLTLPVQRTYRMKVTGKNDELMYEGEKIIHRKENPNVTG